MPMPQGLSDLAGDGRLEFLKGDLKCKCANLAILT